MINSKKSLKFLLLIFIFSTTIALWFYTKLVIQNQQFTTDTLLNFSQLFAVIAAVEISINFLLATRAYFIEKLFVGLDKMYKFHKWNARIAFVFLWSHPLLLAINSFLSIESIKYYFLPFQGQENRYNLGMIALYVMTLIIILTVTNFIPYHIWKNIHRLMIIPMILIFFHVISAPGTLNANIVFKLWVSAWILVGILCWLYIEFLYKRFGPVFYYQVAKVNVIGSVTELYLHPQNKPMLYKAGQFTFISFLNNKQIGSEFHPFTISSNPHEYFIRISAKNSGDFTSKLPFAKEGDLVKLIGPYGLFTKSLVENAKKQIWIAGGIGVTPFLSMLSLEKDEPTGNRIDFFYTTSTEQECWYKTEVTKNAENLEHLNLNILFTKKDGHLTGAKIQELIGYNIKESNVLLCGPTKMMHDLKTQLIELGVNKDQIFFEDFALKPV